jgi:hypothetical protein
MAKGKQTLHHVTRTRGYIVLADGQPTVLAAGGRHGILALEAVKRGAFPNAHLFNSTRAARGAINRTPEGLAEMFDIIEVVA